MTFRLPVAPSDEELVKKKREEINNILSENKAAIESGEIISSQPKLITQIK